MRVEEYWLRGDPAYIDGQGAESFADLVQRAQSLLDRLSEHPAEDIAVFSHGQFINTVIWLLQCQPQRLDGAAMLDWRAYEIANHVKNGCGYQLVKTPETGTWALSHNVSTGGVAEPLAGH